MKPEKKDDIAFQNVKIDDLNDDEVVALFSRSANPSTLRSLLKSMLKADSALRSTLKSALRAPGEKPSSGRTNP
jgi:hypothetical protein